MARTLWPIPTALTGLSGPGPHTGPSILFGPRATGVPFFSSFISGRSGIRTQNRRGESINSLELITLPIPFGVLGNWDPILFLIVSLVIVTIQIVHLLKCSPHLETIVSTVRGRLLSP